MPVPFSAESLPDLPEAAPEGPPEPSLFELLAEHGVTRLAAGKSSGGPCWANVASASDGARGYGRGDELEDAVNAALESILRNRESLAAVVGK